VMLAARLQSPPIRLVIRDNIIGWGPVRREGSRSRRPGRRRPTSCMRDGAFHRERARASERERISRWQSLRVQLVRASASPTSALTTSGSARGATSRTRHGRARSRCRHRCTQRGHRWRSS
jgi:hypothetical protein